MNFNNIKEKALWRMPNSHEIFGIDNQDRGEDRFMIAPFLRENKFFFVKGKCKVIAQYEVENFIEKSHVIFNHKEQTSKIDYIQLVEKALTQINDNQFEKVVLAREVFIEKEINAAALFLALEAKYPHALVFWFKLNNGLSMIGATPETLMSKTNETLFIEALGGTQQSYGYTQKEEDEHQQIVNYIKTILIDNSTQFSVGEKLSKNAGNVAHLCTPISVVSKGMALDNDLLLQLHPTSAVCGLPYTESLKFIVENESFKREFYAGYIGPKLANQDFHYFVNLRSGNLYQNGINLYAGAGINKLSIPADEWQETENKLQTISTFL